MYLISPGTMPSLLCPPSFQECPASMCLVVPHDIHCNRGNLLDDVLLSSHMLSTWALDSFLQYKLVVVLACKAVSSLALDEVAKHFTFSVEFVKVLSGFWGGCYTVGRCEKARLGAVFPCLG